MQMTASVMAAAPGNGTEAGHLIAEVVYLAIDRIHPFHSAPADSAARLSGPEWEATGGGVARTAAGGLVPG
jgi:hypothetical protein